MSLALKLDSITDFKIAGEFYRPGSISVAHSNCAVWSYGDVFTKHATYGGGLILDWGGRVWLDVNIADGYGGFTRGGYLEEVEHQYHFSLPGGSDTILVKTLGVSPAAYAGGVKITGIKSPPNTWTDITPEFRALGYTTGAVRISESGSFVWNGSTWYLTNWVASAIGNAYGSVTAFVQCAVANDIRFSWGGSP